MTRLTLWSTLVVGASLILPGAAEAQLLSGKLLYNAITPCRIVDTSNGGGGAIPANTSRAFKVLGTATDYSSQGGTNAGCAIPDLGKVQAIFLNIVAKNPSGPGNLRAYPGDQVSVPQASTLNFQKLTPNLNVANGITIPVRTTGPAGDDLNVYDAVSSTDVVIDVVGYFTKATRRFYLTTASHLGDDTLGVCAAGFHFASMWEIRTPELLQYDAGLGYTKTDDGAGPPVQYGWVRTGAISGNAGQPGLGNCNAWTSSSFGDNGSVVILSSNWTITASVVSPWIASAELCGNGFRVWCIED